MLEAKSPAASAAGHAKDGKWLDVAQPEGGGWRLKHMRDCNPDDGRVADCDHVTALGGLGIHPASDALSQVEKTLAAVRGHPRLGHPGHEIFRLFRLDRLDRSASPAAMVAISKPRINLRFETERLSRLAGAQGGACDNTIGVGQGGDSACFFHCLFFQRFVERKQGFAVRRRRAVTDPGEARIHGVLISEDGVGTGLPAS